MNLPGNPIQGGRLNTIDLLVKIAYLKNIVTV
jgi:hypothetical protein